METDSRHYFQIPENCPICKSPTVVQGDFLYCKSDLCPSKLTGSVKVWVERLGILHWGDALIGSLTNSDDPAISTIADLYRLTVDDLEVHCSGRKMAEKCWNTLHKNESVPFEVVLAALNVPNLGPSTATDIVDSGFNDVDKLLAASEEDLQKVPNVGIRTACQVAEGLRWKAQELRDLQTVITMPSSPKGALSGLKICITGDVWAPRKAVQKMIVEAGGKAVNGVAKDTSLLVCDDVGSSTTKSKKAAKYNVPMISGDDLKALLDGHKSIDEFIQ